MSSARKSSWQLKIKRSKISGSIGKIWLRPRSIGKIWPRWYELGQNFDNYKVSQKPTGNYFLSVLSTKIKLAIENEEVDIFDVIGKIWLRAKSKAKFGLGNMN